MNILFVLYGDLGGNSANPLAIYAREFCARGYSCVVAIPKNLRSINQHANPAFRPVLYSDALSNPDALFSNGCPADVIHAWTPRENVRRFVTSYMAKRPTPLVVYLEDHESWISCRALGLDEKTLVQQSEKNITESLPDALSHPFHYGSFIGLADVAVVIQEKLKIDVPSWVPCRTVMPGVDLDFFSPRFVDVALRKKYGVSDNERVIVYPGGLNGFTRPAIETLCRAVGLINQQGYPCKLLRTGPFALDFLAELPKEASDAVVDLGVVSRDCLPDLLALADVFVQPGKIDPFEDLRLPGKLPELLAMGKPVLMPDVNVSHLFKDGVDAVLTYTGSAEEIVERCTELFLDAEKAVRIGCGGRVFAEKYFDIKLQAKHMEAAYRLACKVYSHPVAAKVWRGQIQTDSADALVIVKLRELADLYVGKLDINVPSMLREHADLMVSKNLRVAGLEATIAERDTTIAKREGEIAERVNAEAKILGSISWRITRPVRFVGRQLIKVKAAIKGFPYALKMCGGVYGLTKHLWRIYRIEGMWGIQRRVFFSAAPGTPPPVIDYSGDKAEGVRGQSARNDYDEWIKRYDTLDEQARTKIKAKVSLLSQSPLISIVMPVFNPPLDMLEAAIKSVQYQLYPHWELCIADDASTQGSVRTLLQRYADSDRRIKVTFREKNGHISAASNSALELATGEYIALLDNDDLLREHALYFLAEAINTHPDVGLIYSDEDKIDQSGRRYDPHFKPDWNPDLFLSYNMICHLGAYRADLVRALGGFRVGLEGAQDYDLALRCTEQLSAQQIVHIPRVLYHWRSHAGSTAQAGSEKNYALIAGEQALNDHFARMSIAARAELLEFGMYRTKYDLPVPAPLVSLIIPTRNGLQLIKQCIESIIAKTTYQNYEILIIDNNSDDPATLAYFASLVADSRIRVIRDEQPFNYSALNNAAVQQARGEYVALVNNDIEVITPEWLDEMMGLATQPGVGAVGARLWYPNNTLQHGGCITGVGGVTGHSHKHLPRGQFGYFARAQLIQTLSVVTAACLVVKKSIFVEVGGLDEVNLKVAFNDVDFCLRVRQAGYRNIWTPYAELCHHESATRGHEDTPEKQLRFRDEVLYMKKRWANVLMSDPAYSPNLTLDREDFTYAWPPRVSPI